MLVDLTKMSYRVKTNEGQNQNSSKSISDQFTDNLDAQDLTSSLCWGSACRIEKQSGCQKWL